MTCARIRDLFGAYWDDETTQAERERIEAHLSACGACRERYESFARALELVASLPRVDAAPDLLERVTAGARRAVTVPDRLPAAAPAPRWVPVAVAAAALVVAAVAVAPRLMDRVERVAGLANGPSPAEVVREPALVRAVPAGAVDVVPEAPATPAASTPAIPAAALTDSLFDHSEDVEFIVAPTALRRGRDAARSSPGMRTGSAMISF